MYIKKINSIIGNSIIRVTAGVLITLEGIISLSSLLPFNLMSTKSVIQASQVIGQNRQVILTKVVISNVISVVIILCQILIGVYLVKFYKNKAS